MIASKVRITPLESPHHGLQNHFLPYHYVELIFLVKFFFEILCPISGPLRSRLVILLVHHLNSRVSTCPLNHHRRTTQT